MNAPARTSRYAAAEGVAVEVARAARECERAVDDALGGLVDERLRGLHLGEELGDVHAATGLVARDQ